MSEAWNENELNDVERDEATRERSEEREISNSNSSDWEPNDAGWAEVDLRKDETAPIPRQMRKVVVGLGWDPADKAKGARYDYDLDVSAFLVNDRGVFSNKKNYVYYKNMTSPAGAVELSDDDRNGSNSDGGDDEQIVVDLAALSREKDFDVEKGATIVFCVSLYRAREREQSFGQIENAYVRIYNADTKKALYRYSLSDMFPTATALEFGRLYMNPSGEWVFRATGVEYRDEEKKNKDGKFVWCSGHQLLINKFWRQERSDV